MKTEPKVAYSVIVPVYNEKENVRPLYEEIKEVMESLKKPYEIIFVDDGSRDETLSLLKTLESVVIISLRKNFGQSTALDVGIKESRGEILITLDGDLQNDPKNIPLLISELTKGYDVVCGWRKNRKDSFTKRFVSYGAKFLRRIFVNDGVHDAGCTLRVYRRFCFDGLDLYGEMHRMIPAILKWRGYQVGEVVVNHRPRVAGNSKYSYQRIIRGFLDMVTVWFWRKYEDRPLHLFGTLGLILVIVSILGGGYLAILRAFFDYRLSDKIWPLLATTTFIAGIQFFIFGLIADLIIKGRSRNQPHLIREILR
jgi:glycosyltransferase involved in cell wall biosynthesis